MKKIRKVVIPAAGFGTRFLPQTKAMPKEMLPIVDKPVIQYVVEEAVNAGIEDVIIITGSAKRAIEDHFDLPNEELIKNLNEGGKQEMAEEITRIGDMANFIYIRQKGPYGNATPVLSAEPALEDEPFLVLWGDEFVVAQPSRASQLIAAYEKYNATILGGMIKDGDDDYNRYGYVKGTEVEKGVWKVEGLVEKPGKADAPSSLAIVANYLLTPDIFPILNEQKPGKGGEYYLPEAINALAQTTPVYAIEIQNARYYDTGNKLEYLKTVVELGLKHPDINGELKQFLKELNLS
ncbi:MAG TPA: UTP--glucose-1-phosphate uridylyltransferase [Patescibacteria group bacterium]|jgi:UTP--glucose-1-phosphate uridylyltransferase|nr:UTP--glucose-1-phosphate uridylyltransferase [Patescibacteria group bacterium]